MESFRAKLLELELVSKRIYDLKKALAEAEGNFELQLSTTKQAMRQVVDDGGCDLSRYCKSSV